MMYIPVYVLYISLSVQCMCALFSDLSMYKNLKLLFYIKLYRIPYIGNREQTAQLYFMCFVQSVCEAVFFHFCQLNTFGFSKLFHIDIFGWKVEISTETNETKHTQLHDAHEIHLYFIGHCSAFRNTWNKRDI